MTIYKKTPVALALAASLNSSIALATNADADMETIIVQGDFRQAELKRSASAVSIVGAEQMVERGAQNLEEKNVYKI